MAEVEERIARIRNHKGVKGLLIVDEKKKVHRSTMGNPKTDHETKMYSIKVTDLAIKARNVVRDLDPLNDMVFFRVRSKREEIMVAPDKNLLVIVRQVIGDENDQ